MRSDLRPKKRKRKSSYNLRRSTKRSSLVLIDCRKSRTPSLLQLTKNGSRRSKSARRKLTL